MEKRQQPVRTAWLRFGVGVAVVTMTACVGYIALSAQEGGGSHCVKGNDTAGCQPGTFVTPLTKMPTVRLDREGKPDPFSSEADARAGAALLEKQLGLFRNFQHLHWVTLVPSVKDPATGGWRGGDLDGAGAGRSFAVGGECIFIGHITSRVAAKGLTRPMNILRIQPDPEKQAPVHVGQIPAPPGTNADGRGVDDKEVRSLMYQVAPGQDRQIAVRLVDGLVQSYRIDPATCLPIAESEPFEIAGDPHEFYLWHDPANAKRVLIFVSMTGGGVPDAARPGMAIPDAYAFAITDDKTGEMLPRPRVLAGFSLSDVGGPPVDELPDATGLFSDGRFADFSHLPARRAGDTGLYSRRQSNALHSLTVSDDGERVYIAGGTAGFYVLNSEAIAHSGDATLAAGQAGCNQYSTAISRGGVVDGSRISGIANDCLRMVVNDDPGLKALLASNASPEAKAQRYLVMLTRSRLDVHPPVNSSTGIHSAVPVPNRPARVRGNTKNRPGLVFLTDENFGCPYGYSRIVSIDSEASPVMVGAFGLSSNDLDACLDFPAMEPDGRQPRPKMNFQSHNPTVFTNLVFIGHMGDGVRVIDISNPLTPREVGHALTVPSANQSGSARGYVVFKDGLMYWHDIGNGLHVAKYTGPRSDELPKKGAGIYDSNSTSPHR